MPNVPLWGRKESLIWPRHGYLYTWGALALAIIAAGLFIWIRFQYGLNPIERYYLPYYMRSEIAGSFRPSGNYQLLYVADGKSHTRPALDVDVELGHTPQPSGK